MFSVISMKAVQFQKVLLSVFGFWVFCNAAILMVELVIRRDLSCRYRISGEKIHQYRLVVKLRALWSKPLTRSRYTEWAKGWVLLTIMACGIVWFWLNERYHAYLNSDWLEHVMLRCTHIDFLLQSALKLRQLCAVKHHSILRKTHLRNQLLPDVFLCLQWLSMLHKCRTLFFSLSVFFFCYRVSV